MEVITTQLMEQIMHLPTVLMLPMVPTTSPATLPTRTTEHRALTTMDLTLPPNMDHQTLRATKITMMPVLTTPPITAIAMVPTMLHMEPLMDTPRMPPLLMMPMDTMLIMDTMDTDIMPILH